MSLPLFVKVNGPNGTYLERRTALSPGQLDQLKFSSDHTLVRNNVDVETMTDFIGIRSIGIQAVDQEEMRWMRLGKALCSLKPEDFESKTVGKIEYNGTSIFANVVKFCEVIVERMGNDASGTILSKTHKAASLISGVSHVTAISRISGDFTTVARKVEDKIRQSKRSKWNHVGGLVSEETKDKIRMRLQECWKEEKLVTLDNLLEWAKTDIRFPYSRTTMAHLLHSMDLCFQKKKRNPIIVERKDLVSWRRWYLEKITQLRAENSYIVYMDETWVWDGMLLEKGWQYSHNTGYELAELGCIECPRPGPPRGKEKGKRAIVLGVFGEEGMLPGSSQILVSGLSVDDQTLDYHKEMSSEVFEQYMQTVIETLANTAPTGRQAVLIIDNAPYPPYHCFLNPIEYVWGQLKGSLRKEGKTTDTIEVTRQRALAWLNNLSASEAEKTVSHIIDIEMELMHKFAESQKDSETAEELDIDDIDE